MNRFFKTRLATIIITVLVVSIALTGIAFAAGTFDKTLSVSANINSPNKSISFYSDVNCTNPITSISFGDITQGDSKFVEFYVKNTSSIPLSNIVYTSNIDPAIATLSFTPASLPAGINKNSSIRIMATLVPVVDGIIGTINPVITFTNSY